MSRKVNSPDKLDLLKLYQTCLSGDKANEYRSGDLLTKITSTLRPNCGYCTGKCGTKWMIQVGQSSPSQTGIVLCMDCYLADASDDIAFAGNYTETNVLNQLTAKDGLKDAKEWPTEDKMKLLEAFEECGMDLSKVIQRFPGRTSHEVVKEFLVTPLNRFGGILKLTNQHFENIFKRETGGPPADEPEDILPYHVNSSAQIPPSTFRTSGLVFRRSPFH